MSRLPPPLPPSVHHPTSSSPQPVMPSSSSSSSSSSNSSPPNKHVLVIAIDFGTARSGYAWALVSAPDRIVTDQKWQCETPNLKTRTDVLLNEKFNLVSFGEKALQDYFSLDDSAKQNHYFFEKFKMSLYGETMTARPLLRATNGTMVPAVTVISQALSFMMQHVMERLRVGVAVSVLPTDILWVLTVPAIWSNGAKQLMREAALKAGLYTDERQLLLALEPEAAAICCKASEAVANCDDLKPGVQYMILDCGGGTVDVTVHRINSDSTLKESMAPSGGPWGSTYIDEEFVKVVCEIFPAAAIQSFKQMHPIEWAETMTAFEIQKINLSSADNSKSYHIRLPYSLDGYLQDQVGQSVSFYLNEYNKRIGNNNGISFRRGLLVLSHDVMMSLFMPVLNRTIDHVKQVMSKVGAVRFLFLVGGFVESEVLLTEIEKVFGEGTSYNCKVVRPHNASMAVLQGAVMYGLKPRTISIRIAKHTYGIAAMHPWDESVHARDNRKKIMKEGRAYCDWIFSKFITAGEEIPSDKRIQRTFSPVTSDQTSMSINVFASPKSNPSYTDEEGCAKVAALTVEMPVIHGGTNRNVQVAMLFGDTEIIVEALDETTGKRTTAKIDFLYQS